MRLIVFLNGRVVYCYDLVVFDNVILLRDSDFRTAFKSIGGLRALTSAPFMALSASTPPAIAKVIEESQGTCSSIAWALGT